MSEAQRSHRSRAMTKEQSRHVTKIADQFARLVRPKYAHGVKTHGGNLWERSQEHLVDQAIDEAIDQVVYLLTLREKMRVVGS